jgi:hypothetical protein
MDEPKLTNAQRRERRREAALKGSRTRAAKPDATPEATPEPTPAPEPAGPTARQLLDRARSIGRESDLFYHAHLGRWPSQPSAWTAAQRADAEAFLDRFIRPDGLAQPVPHRGRKPR